ncbi:FAD-dependent monooxygenase, partial [Frankia sp. Mgl5]|uniref:FAD-dependent monooxygenase n=1 Tax=Frankia sp. Mgl5 TaxID=2933793 RepID=UPI00200FF1EA
MAERVDALIVGYGPVGQVMSLLLARRGWQVAVVERWLDAFPMPRAVAFDSEGARILAAAGIGAALNRIGEPSGEYTWRNAEDQTLLHVNVAERGLCGWPESISMHQPSLEAALTAQGAALENLVVHRGNEAVAAVERGDGVEVTVRDKSGGQVVIPARWVIGCDGAKSFVRQAIGASIKDFGFSHDWLICDVIPHQPQDYYPNNLQICDPARPRTEVSAGPGHRRWEFMRIEGEKVADLNTADSAWRLLELFGVRPDNATLERQH